MRPRIYVAGPLTAETPEERAANVARAIDIAEQLWALGWAPVVPHTYSERWNERHPHTEEEWLELCHSLLDGCDAVYRMVGESPGATREFAWAKELHLPVAFTMSYAAGLVETIRRAA